MAGIDALPSYDCLYPTRTALLRDNYLSKRCKLVQQVLHLLSVIANFEMYWAAITLHRAPFLCIPCLIECQPLLNPWAATRRNFRIDSTKFAGYRSCVIILCEIHIPVVRAPSPKSMLKEMIQILPLTDWRFSSNHSRKCSYRSPNYIRDAFLGGGNDLVEGC